MQPLSSHLLASIVAYLNILDDKPATILGAFACIFSNRELETIKQFWIKQTAVVSQTLNGDERCTVNGVLHSWNGKPAIIKSGGYKYWYSNGKLKRDDGPSYETCWRN